MPTPTFIIPEATATNTAIPMIPTKTPLPDYCPNLASGGDIFQVGSAIQFEIANPNVSGATKTDVTSVELSWPSDPAANLQELRFGGSVNTCDSTVEMATACGKTQPV